MSALYARLQEARRLLDHAEAERRRHGSHPRCPTCETLDSALGRARRELDLYERALGRAPASVWWPRADCPPKDMA